MVKIGGFADPYDNGWSWGILTELCLVGLQEGNAGAASPGLTAVEKQRDYLRVLDVFNPIDGAGVKRLGRAPAGCGRVCPDDRVSIVAGVPVIRRFTLFAPVWGGRVIDDMGMAGLSDLLD